MASRSFSVQLASPDPIFRLNRRNILLLGFLILGRATGLLLFLFLLRLLLLLDGELLKLQPLLLAHGLLALRLLARGHRGGLGLCRSHPRGRR